MESRPKAPDVEEVLAGLDQSWQELVKLLKEGQGRPTPQGPEAQESVPPGSHLKEDGAPSLDPDRGNGRSSLAPGALAPEQPEEPSHASAPEAAQEKAPPKGRGQKVYNIAILLILAVSLGGLSFLLAQTQWGRGQVNTESLTIRGKDGVARAWLGERDGQVSLRLLDKAGRSRAQMTLDAAGSPSFTMFDELQKSRVELKMGAGGEPRLIQIKEPGKPAIPLSKAPAPPGGEAAPAAAALPENPESPKTAAGPTAATPDQGRTSESAKPEVAGTNAPAVPTGKFVGSKNSNKYHFPECQWAKKIKPERLVTFGSVKEAREKGYIPCPTCKPPAR